MTVLEIRMGEKKKTTLKHGDPGEGAEVTTEESGGSDYAHYHLPSQMLRLLQPGAPLLRMRSISSAPPSAVLQGA